MEDDNENQTVEFQKEETSLPLPFPIFTIKKIAKQALVIHKQNKPNYQRGISQKAAVVLSFATGIFLKHLSREVVANSQEKYIRRKLIANTLMKNPIYRFATINRMKMSELFDYFTNDNELSRRIAFNHIEEKIPFPIEFVAPHPPEKHEKDEVRANKNEADNYETIVKRVLMANRAYRQTIPSFLNPSKNVH